MTPVVHNLVPAKPFNVTTLMIPRHPCITSEGPHPITYFGAGQSGVITNLE